MPRLAVCRIGVTRTHPLPPLKRGELNGEAQFFWEYRQPSQNFQFSILNSQFLIQKRGRAERRSAVAENAGSHLIILTSAFLILNFLTHPLPPLKRGGLSGEVQFVEIPAVIL
jgi:hypothetical protein